MNADKPHPWQPGALDDWPVLGQGTWGMGAQRSTRSAEIEALRLGFSLGMTLVDTAEFYAMGGAERLVAEAISDCREQIVLVTKVWPSHASYTGVVAAARRSLDRLRTDYVDVLLLHWPSRSHPLEETVRAFQWLIEQGWIRGYGLSNFSADWLRHVPTAAHPPLVNQIPYGVLDRRAERGLIQACQAESLRIMAYSPLAHGRMAQAQGLATLDRVAAQKGCTPAQAALAFALARTRGLVVVKAVSAAHVRQNAAASAVVLSDQEMAQIAAAFPVPTRPFKPLWPHDLLFDPVWRAAAVGHRMRRWRST